MSALVKLTAAQKKAMLAADKKARAAWLKKHVQKNPAPRKGTAKPKRPSQATGKAPSKRLVARRTSNTKKGYFPNPAEVKQAHTRKTYQFPTTRICLQFQYKDDWLDVDDFPDTPAGIKKSKVEAHLLAKTLKAPIRVVRS